jgi:hypothetical protein
VGPGPRAGRLPGEHGAAEPRGAQGSDDAVAVGDVESRGAQGVAAMPPQIRGLCPGIV